jgi:hypothetical protein
MDKTDDIWLIDMDAAEEIMTEYLFLKIQQKDWRCVSDAANDLREMFARKEKNND